MSGSGIILSGLEGKADGPPSPASGIAATDFLTSFNDQYAAQIVEWVRDVQELLWLAPGTPPPLTAQKVLDWGRERRRRHLFWQAGQASPSGYAELNEMPGPTQQMWVGHFLVDPKIRMRGLGTRFATALVMRAFVEFGVEDVLLVVFPENAGAIRCYERAGLVVLGKEKKQFESTGREHMFLRMGIGRRRFTKLASKGLLPTQPVPFRELPNLQDGSNPS